MQLERLKNLFNLIKVIKSKYATSKELDFNIFTVLRKEHDEVNLHSQFIVELLSNIPHYSNIFLKLFLEQIGEVDFFDSKIKVLKEYKNIDVLLKNGNDALIIENKIYAEDQEEQLERYYKEIKTRHNKVKVFYLTLDSHDPSEQSLGDTLSLEGEKVEGKEEVINLSYDKNISEWLEKCIKESSRVPTLRETLIQYLEVVNKLTGNTINKDYQSEVSEYLMKSSKNILLAKDIKEGYEKAVNSLKLKFWEELEEARMKNKILKNFICSESYKYSKKKIEKNSKNYGLMYQICQLNEETKLSLIYEIDHYFYFGFLITKDEIAENICLEEEYRTYKEQIHEVFCEFVDSIEFEENYSNISYFAWAYSKPNINYRNPSEEFLKLADKEYRKNFINDFVKTTSEITEKIVNKISSEVK